MKKTFETILFAVLGLVYVLFSLFIIWYLINLIVFNMGEGIISLYIVLGLCVVELAFGFFSLNALTKRFTTYESKLNQSEKERFDTLFQEVKTKAKRSDVKLILFNDAKNEFLGSPALALQSSKSYIGLSEAIKKEDDEVIKGLVAHEMYHIISNFNIIYFYINILSFVFSLIFLVLLQAFQGLMRLLHKYKKHTFLYIIFLILYILVVGLLLIIRLPYNILIAPLNRYEERQADKFACSLGYAEGLRYGLFKVTKDSKVTKKHVFYWIMPIHPIVDLRLDAMHKARGEKYDSSFFIIKDKLFYSTSEAEEILIPGCVTEIAPQRIMHHTNKVVKIDFNKTEVIGADSFRNCVALKEVVFKIVEVVKQNAFFNCFKLESLTLSSNLKRIEDNAFLNAKFLKQSKEGFVVIDSWALACNAPNAQYLEIPKDVLCMQDDVFKHTRGVEYINILNPDFNYKEKLFTMPKLKFIIWETTQDTSDSNYQIVNSLEQFKGYMMDLIIFKNQESMYLEKIKESNTYEEVIAYYNEDLKSPVLTLN